MWEINQLKLCVLWMMMWNTKWEREHEDNEELAGEEELDSSAKRSLTLDGLEGAGAHRCGEQGEDWGICFVTLELQSPSAFPWCLARSRRSPGSRTRGSSQRWMAAAEPMHGSGGPETDDFFGEESWCCLRSVSQSVGFHRGIMLLRTTSW
jgi:hypothetical protein